MTKDGREVFRAKKSDIYWDKIHLSGGEIYGRAWEMVMEESAPTTEYEEQIYENMKDKLVMEIQAKSTFIFSAYYKTK